MCQQMSGCLVSESWLGGTLCEARLQINALWSSFGQTQCPRSLIPSLTKSEPVPNYHHFTYCFCHQISHSESCLTNACKQ